VSCGGHDKIEISAEQEVVPSSQVSPKLKVYLENSGSMNGYMCAGSQLKDALFDYVSDLNACTDTTELYYINSKIIPCKSDLDQYIKHLDPQTFHKAGGNMASTDIGSMFKVILKELDKQDVAIFVSDCILDLPAVNAQKFLTNCQIEIKNAITNGRKSIPNLGVEIIKMSSDFEGRYFYPDGKIESLSGVKRPYYIWILGDATQLSKLNRAVPINDLKKYGLEGIASFTSMQPLQFELKNRNLTSTVITPVKGDYPATILVDFSNTLLPNDVTEKTTNYTFNNQQITVDGIYPIADKNSKYTHFIQFTIPKSAKIIEDHLVMNKPQNLPAWVEVSNDETGADIKSHLSQTTGIKSLITGVADAYKNENIITSLKFSIKRK
jgi:hypothetical protein